MTERAPNPFETAIRQHGVMNVALQAADLMHADPSLTQKDAERLISMLRHLVAEGDRRLLARPTAFLS
jgi:hypothetical protein